MSGCHVHFEINISAKYSEARARLYDNGETDVYI